MTMLEALMETHPDVDFLIADGFDDAIIGYDSRGERLIYSVSKAIQILIYEGMNEEDAMEHFYFNVEGAYVGDKTPIWSDDLNLQEWLD